MSADAGRTSAYREQRETSDEATARAERLRGRVSGSCCRLAAAANSAGASSGCEESDGDRQLAQRDWMRIPIYANPWMRRTVSLLLMFTG
ncbi:hypothetical protein HPP92_004079 [Vanilla planifolia]|uniref:Uncharacterized protein n=1 Tax=Vanilla planifolia TaxID=51239 RepID=A0A835VM31_VANPL|nr:hypothetical protein HPP92_004079 [Vanilla planifolia]